MKIPFFNRIKLTYGITVCNEVVELKTLLDFLLNVIDKKDEVIVLKDITRPNEHIDTLLLNYENIKCISAKLQGDFATFKNHLIASASGDYLFQIDADEMPSTFLLTHLKRILKSRPKIECFLIPRINIVHGLTEEDVQNWNWTVNEKGYVNFPDFQYRLFKLNGKIRWKNKVHEVLDGYQKWVSLPIANENYCLTHIKNIERQRAQNNLYNTLDNG